MVFINCLHSLPSPSTACLRSAACKPWRTAPIRLLSSSSKIPRPSQHSFSDRGLVIGLLSLTTLAGFGLGTRSRSQDATQNTDKNGDKSSKNSISHPLETTASHPSEDHKLTNSNNKNQDQVEQGSSSENDSGQGGAFNPETGEINWDCPCLGGMAHGTCGEQFKAAFSCFVYSEQEPKGVECIEKFKLMQDCFKDHPEEYGPELADNDDSTAEDGTQSADSSEGGERAGLDSEPKDMSEAGGDRELTAPRPVFTTSPDDGPGDRSNSPSHATLSNDINLSTTNATPFSSPQFDSDAGRTMPSPDSSKPPIQDPSRSKS